MTRGQRYVALYSQYNPQDGYSAVPSRFLRIAHVKVLGGGYIEFSTHEDLSTAELESEAGDTIVDLDTNQWYRLRVETVLVPCLEAA